VHFFDDFSSTAVGRKPPNWRSTLDDTGASSVVTELKGLDGHWASMSGMQLTPTRMKAPLPRDFEVRYDLIAAQNHPWGAHGLTFRLSRAPAAGTGESFLSLRIRPGFSGGDGEVVVEALFPRPDPRPRLGPAYRSAKCVTTGIAWPPEASTL